MKKFLCWLPRILAICYVLFFSVFAFDSVENSTAFIMHMLPSCILIVLTGIAWKKKRIGGILFCLAGLCASVFYHSLWIAMPVFLIGILFLIGVIL
jgi:hypothetical protein